MASFNPHTKSITENEPGFPDLAARSHINTAETKFAQSFPDSLGSLAEWR